MAEDKWEEEFLGQIATDLSSPTKSTSVLGGSVANFSNTIGGSQSRFGRRDSLFARGQSGVGASESRSDVGILSNLSDVPGVGKIVNEVGWWVNAGKESPSRKSSME